MHDKYRGRYCQTVQFDQKTLRYENGNLKDTSYWYEWISYPDMFRIDFGKKYGGSCVIFRDDSVFNYRNHKLVRAADDQNDLLLLLGGMYHRTFEDVIGRLRDKGYDLDSVGYIKEGDNTVYYIGSYPQDKQESFGIFVDTKDLKVIGIKTKLSDQETLVIRFDAFKKSCGGFTETKVTAYKNGELEQKEEYLHLKTNVSIPDSIFHKK
jgi:outer membrane lipoprotein-sorting protein